MSLQMSTTVRRPAERRPEMTDREFDDDAAAVRADLDRRQHPAGHGPGNR